LLAFLLWALAVCAAVFDVGDPAARALVADRFARVPLIVTHVPAGITVLAGVVLFALAVLGPGLAVLRCFRVEWRDRFERLVFALAAGLIVATVVTFLVGSAGLLFKPVGWGMVAAGCALTFVETLRLVRELGPQRARHERKRRGWDRGRIACWAIGAALLVIAITTLLGALGPEVEFDARMYHLAEAKRYAAHHGFYNIVAADRAAFQFALPQYQEFLYTDLFALFGATGAKLFAWLGGLFTAAVIVTFARVHFRSHLLGLTAALVFLGTPIVGWGMTTANNDLATAPFGILALHAFLRWLDDRRRAWIVLMGAFAGYNYGVKSTGAFTLFSLLVLLIVAMLRRRSAAAEPRRDYALLPVYCAAALIVMLPAFVRSFTLTGNPVYPYLGALFPLTPSAVEWNYVASRTFHRALSAGAALALPWTITVDPYHFRNLIGPVWLIALPVWIALAWVARKTQPAIPWIVGFTVLWCAPLWLTGNVEARYAQIPFALVAVLIAYAMTAAAPWTMFGGALLRAVFGAVVVACLVMDSWFLLPLQRHSAENGVMGNQFVAWNYLYEGAPEGAVQGAPDLQYINAHLGPNDKVYDASLLGQLNLYSDVDLYNGYGTVRAVLGRWSLVSPDALDRLRAGHITYVDVWAHEVPILRRAPLWPHLHQVFSSEGTQPKYDRVLFAVSYD